LALVFALIVPLRARAQGTGSPPQGELPARAPAPRQPTAPDLVVVPPALLQDEGVAYPKQALAEGMYREVEVQLRITVDAAGAVTEATLVSPVGHGFDEAALEAAHRLRFQPATRDGKPISARIAFVYRFAPPLGVLGGRVFRLDDGSPIDGATVVARDAAGAEKSGTTAADGRWQIENVPPGVYHVTIAAPGLIGHEADESVGYGEAIQSVDRLASGAPAPVPTGATAPEEEVTEVEVRGQRPPREVTKRTLDEREINRIPGTNGDALRSLQNLPGVARPPLIAGILIVRGSGPQDTQTFVDGTPVPIIYHFGGLSSVVPTEMLSKIDFYPGNFSAQYGRAMGGIVDVGLVEPKSDRFHLLASSDFIEVGLQAQGPVLDTGWKFAVGARRSTLDTWLPGVFSATNAGTRVIPVYYDYQAVLQRDFGSSSSVRFAFFGADDRLDLFLPSASSAAPTLTGNGGMHTGFWRAQALYRRKLGESTDLRIVGAAGADYVNFSIGNIFFDLTDWPITARVELAHKLDPHLTMNVGLDMAYGPYTVSGQFPPFQPAGQPPPGPFSASHVVRTQSTDAIYEPGVYAEWEATPWAGARIVPGLRLDYTKDTKAWDLAPRLTVRQDVTRDPRTTVKAGVGVFAQPPQPQETNSVFGTPNLASNRALHYDVGIEREFPPHIEASLEGFYKQLDNLVEQKIGNTGSGVVYGAETLIRYKPDERFFGWIAYTLSRSLRRTQPGAPLRIFQYDETHILTILGSYRLGAGWEIGARYRLTSGFMTTPSRYGLYDENVSTYVPLLDYPPNGTRLPLFHQLDIRIDKTWNFGWARLGAYLDVLNVYNQGNVEAVGYDFNFTHSTYTTGIPFIPSIGFRLEH
jgi:TonB family protein